MVLFLNTLAGMNSVISRFNSDREKTQTRPINYFLLKRYINASVFHKSTYNMDFSLEHFTVKSMLK